MKMDRSIQSIANILNNE
jgi:hypothetical protein